MLLSENVARSLARTFTVLSFVSSLVVLVGCSTNSDGTSQSSSELKSIEVTPDSASIAIGDKQQFTATGKYADDSTKNITDSVTWSSEKTATATVSDDDGSKGLATAVAAGSVMITAKSGDVTGSVTLTVKASGMTTPATLVSIAVTPVAPSIAKGSKQAFVATGTYSDNSTKDLSASATWASETQATATITSAGLATGVGAGTTKITATSGSVSGSATLTVTEAKLVSISVTPDAPSIAKGTTQSFVATGTYDDASKQNLTASVTWASATTATATISSAGLATAVAAGTTVISATSGTIKGMVTLTVTGAKLVSIAVTPAAPSAAKGTKVQFIATGSYDDATTQDLSATVTWASATAATATVSNTAGTKGLASTLAAGTSEISATLGAISGKTTLTVTAAVLASIAVTPATPSVAKGSSAQFVATGTYSDATTQDLSATVTWASATPATATISNASGSAGQATTLAAGTTEISATSGTIVGKTTLTVTGATLMSIAVTPATPKIAKATKLAFTATGKYSDGTTQDVTATATWASATVATATISNAAGSIGLASGVAAGTSEISAAVGAVSGKVTLTVSDATLVSLAVSPPLPSIAKGRTQAFSAIGFFSDATRQDLTSTATWASSVPAKASVSNAAGSIGLVSAEAVGPSEISAAIGAINGSTIVTVSAAVLNSIDITPALPSIAKGTKQQFTATGTYSDGSKQALTGDVAWSSATTATAVVSSAGGSKGQASGVTEGSSVITATLDGINGKTTLTVTAATLVSLAVTPATPSVAVGTTQQFVATGTYSDNTTQALTSSVTWASATEAKATISNAAASKGLATAIAAGPSVISATLGAISGNTTLTVSPGTLVSITVTPATPTIAKTTKVQFVATGNYSDQTTQDLSTQVTWSSEKPAVATILSNANVEGLATGHMLGTSVISAKLGALTGSTLLKVTDAKLISIAVTPLVPTIAKGTKTQFVANGFFDDTSVQDITDTVTWASATTGVAVVSSAAGSNGLATAVTVGTSQISATAGTITGKTVLTVSPATLVSIAVTPAVLSMAKGTKQLYVAKGTYTDNSIQDITQMVTWASSVVASATVSNAANTWGLVSAVAIGATEISATSGTVVGKTALTVTAATLVSIAVTPAAPSIVKGTTKQFMAEGTYSDASKQDLTPTTTWASSMTSVAGISNAGGSRGLATSALVGTTEISATTDGIVGKVTLTVTPAP
jgi:trimeric autotransporter adhesin